MLSSCRQYGKNEFFYLLKLQIKKLVKALTLSCKLRNNCGNKSTYFIVVILYRNLWKTSNFIFHLRHCLQTRRRYLYAYFRQVLIQANFLFLRGPEFCRGLSRDNYQGDHFEILRHLCFVVHLVSPCGYQDRFHRF